MEGGGRGSARDSLHAPSATSATRTRGALAIRGYDINPRSRKIEAGEKGGELGERAIGRAGRVFDDSFDDFSAA